MNKAIIALILLSSLFLFTAGTAQAEIYMQLNVHEEGTADFIITLNLDPAVYNETKKANVLNENTLITAINASFVEITFNDTAHSIEIVCSISDDRIKEEINMDEMIVIISVDTKWRKFELPLTNDLSINFTKLLSPKVSLWRKNSERNYLYSTLDVKFGKVTFEILGPESTIRSYTKGETVVFEVPSSKFDFFVNSPYMIFLIVVIVIFVAAVYRKLRYG